MRIVSFLLVALVALGFLLSDSMHLREDMSSLQRQLERLAQAVQQAEQEKQNALKDLQNTNLDLQSCQQTVDQSNQIIARITNENGYLKEQNNLLVVAVKALNPINASLQTRTQMIQSTAFGLITFITLGLGSIGLVVMKSLQSRPSPKRRAAKGGSYVYLTETEVKELVRRRRAVTKSNTV